MDVDGLVGVVVAPDNGELSALSSGAKPMVSLLGKPLLRHYMDGLRAIGASRFIVASNVSISLSDAEVIDYGGDYWATLVKVSEIVPRGSTVVASSMDIYVPREAYETLMNVHLSMGYDVTVLVAAVEDTSGGFRVNTSSDGKVLSLVRGGGPGYLHLGLTAIEQDALVKLAGGAELGSLRVGVAHWGGWFTRVNTPWSLLEIVRNTLANLTSSSISTRARISPRASMEGPVIIDDDAVLDHNCTIRGPVYVGRGVYVGTGALIRNHTAIEEGAVIGANAEVTESLIEPRATIGRGAFIGASLIGHGVVVEPGVVTLTTTMGRKIGAIVGEGARVGANSVLKPGSLVKRGEHVAPLTHYG